MDMDISRCCRMIGKAPAIFPKKVWPEIKHKVYFMAIKGMPQEVTTEVSKVTAKYQVTIPVNVRKEMGIVPGTEVDITKDGQKYVLVVNPIETIKKK